MKMYILKYVPDERGWSRKTESSCLAPDEKKLRRTAMHPACDGGQFLQTASRNFPLIDHSQWPEHGFEVLSKGMMFALVNILFSLRYFSGF